MKKYYVVYIMISLALAFTSYLASSSLIVVGITLAISLLYFFLLFNKRISVYLNETKRFFSCYQFISNFIISLSVKFTVSGALETVVTSMDDDFNEEHQGIVHLEESERLKYLKKYYHFHVYDLFLDVINLYEDRGGDVLDISKYLLKEARYQREYVSESKRLAIKKVIEFSTLWFFALLILVMIRFSLSNFFPLISKQIVYQVMIGVIYLFVLFSVELLARKAFSIDLKGWGEHEKV